MKTSPKVSICIPNYNYARYLDEAIKSVLNQTYTDFELIITDDRSTDNSDEVVQKYLSDPRVSYYKNPVGLGIYGNLNRCIQYAKGTYLKFLCADDKFHPAMLEKFVQVMDTYPQVSLVTADQEIFGLKTEFLRLPYSGLQKGPDMVRSILETYNWVGGPTSVMIRAGNLGPEGFKNSSWLGDWDMWAKQMSLGDAYIISEPLIYSRLHSSQATVVLTKNFSARIEEYEFYKELCGKESYQTYLPVLQKIKKNKARSCIPILYRILPELGSGKNRILFKKAVSIFLSGQWL